MYNVSFLLLKPYSDDTFTKHLTFYWKLELDFLKKKPTLTNEIK